MASLHSRRNFIIASGKASVGAIVGASIISCTAAHKVAAVPNKYATGFKQDPLPYSYDALEQAIDKTTMEIHFTKHAATYAKNLQEAAGAEGVDMTKPVEDVLRNISKYSVKMRNNGGGHYNHEFFWKAMTPNSSGVPTGKLADAITSSFNSFDAFKTQFGDAGKNRFGSGWAWLYAGNDKKLHIGSTPNQDNPLMDIADIKGFPLLGLDVWEHAYYLRYQNKRPDYIAAWWKVVNWNYVQDRYLSII